MVGPITVETPVSVSVRHQSDHLVQQNSDACVDLLCSGLQVVTLNLFGENWMFKIGPPSTSFHIYKKKTKNIKTSEKEKKCFTSCHIPIFRNLLGELFSAWRYSLLAAKASPSDFEAPGSFGSLASNSAGSQSQKASRDRAASPWWLDVSRPWGKPGSLVILVRIDGNIDVILVLCCNMLYYRSIEV